MRIIVTTHYSARVGGVETYIEQLLALLVEAGHEVVAVFDLERVTDGSHVAVPAGVRTHYLESEGRRSVIQSLNEFDGAVVLANSLETTLFSDDLKIRHPVAFYAHTFVASCINGMRLNRRPVPRPCEKVFGPACLLHYFPRRCGGLSPITMITSYRQQTEHQHTLSRFDLVIANSDAVGEQFARAGLPSKTLYPALVSVPGVPRTGFLADERRSLAFVGRFEDYKGGSHLLKALPQAAMQLGMPVHLTMVGDGSQRGAWEQEAIEASARHAGVSVEFTGWLSEDGVSDLLQRSDLLVVPSVWPEPFGLVGLEAAQFGLPSAAFGVGGIPEWLTDGVSGHLADGRRCAPEDLSAAIVRCISDSDEYCQLSRGAVERRTAFSPEAHLQRLEEILRATASAQSG